MVRKRLYDLYWKFIESQMELTIIAKKPKTCLCFLNFKDCEGILEIRLNLY